MKARKQRGQKRLLANTSTGRFQYMDQVMKCVLKANAKVVHFTSAGVSLQDSQGTPPHTWIHHFREPKDDRHLVTLTQKSGNNFRVLTKDKHSNNPTVYSYVDDGDEPDVKTLLNKGLQEHLFIKHTCEARSVSFQYYGVRNGNCYLYVNENLTMQQKPGDDLPDGQNYLFQLERIRK